MKVIQRYMDINGGMISRVSVAPINSGSRAATVQPWLIV
jgi:hypothetical protein